MKLALALILAASTSAPVIAGESVPGYASSESCTRNEYREEYVPGTASAPGYVRSWNESVAVPCHSHSHRRTNVRQAIPQPVGDTNDCSEGSLIGGLLGAGLTMSGSRGKDRWWAVPAGGAAGAMIGCQIDGG